MTNTTTKTALSTPLAGLCFASLCSKALSVEWNECLSDTCSMHINQGRLPHNLTRDSCIFTRAAYRRVPTFQPGYTVVAIWSFQHGGVRFYPCGAHNFGLESSVQNFCRVPAFLTWWSQAYAAMSCAAYIDDYGTLDFHNPRRHGSRSGTLNTYFTPSTLLT